MINYFLHTHFCFLVANPKSVKNVRYVFQNLYSSRACVFVCLYVRVRFDEYDIKKKFVFFRKKKGKAGGGMM